MRTQFTTFRGVTHFFRAFIRRLQNQLTLRMKMSLWQFLKFAFTVVRLLQVILTMALEYDEQKLPAHASSVSHSFFFHSFLHAAPNRVWGENKNATQTQKKSTENQRQMYRRSSNLIHIITRITK